MPIKMLYEPNSVDSFEVDVYSFHQTEELECYALCWDTNRDNWLTIPIYMLRPIKKDAKKKSRLNESKE